MRIPQLNFNIPYRYRKLVLPVGLVLVALLLLWLAASVFKAGSEKVNADELLNKSLHNTLNSKSYRFDIECRLGENKDLISKVQGERVGNEQVHIKGSLINSPVEFVQYYDNTYMKDPFTEQWLTLQGNQLAQAESFIIELNPLANFNFKDVPVLNYAGREELDGQEMQVLELQPNVHIPFLENQFNTFNYKLWIDPKDQRIKRAVIDAGHTGNPRALMNLDLRLYDYDHEIVIQPPLDDKRD
ncbi:hypothetical protein [Desulfofalx alkaliphila]|uniref:hypothetical protein n=1 Tax=Desulfofalx alkaliphila TaxID=105483 RepID=UPI000B265D6E|nr:hypothetical protein [Desulfofalx alkaliphila]